MLILGADTFSNLSTVRQAALLDLSFTMKRSSLASFRRLIAAVQSEQWDKAAAEVLDSKWSRDVDPKQNPDKGRDNRVAYMLKTNQEHPDYKEVPCLGLMRLV